MVKILSDSELELYGIVGKMFREIREEKGLSLEVVSEYLKIAPKSLQRYECGERKIKMGTIKDLCSFYNIDYDTFIIKAKLKFGKDAYSVEVSKEKNIPKIIRYYEMLNDVGKHEATKRVEELTNLPQYIKEEPYFANAAHEDKSSTSEDKRAGDAIMTDDSEWE